MPSYFFFFFFFFTYNNNTILSKIIQYSFIQIQNVFLNFEKRFRRALGPRAYFRNNYPQIILYYNIPIIDMNILV